MLYVDSTDLRQNSSVCQDLETTMGCRFPGVLSEYAHALLRKAGIDYTLTINNESITDWGTYDEESGL